MPQSKRWSKVEVSYKMKQLTEEQFNLAINELMIESEDPTNPNLEHNAYNWGLAHALLLFSGGDVKAIKELQPK